MFEMYHMPLGLRNWYIELLASHKKKENEDPCLIYTRVNNPNMEILEEKLAILDNAELSLVFSSGMAAISNTMFTFLKPNDCILFNEPVYGGTEFLLKNIFI